MEKIRMGMIETVIMEVFEDKADEEIGVPPLFRYQVKFTDIDWERVDPSSLKHTVMYKLTKSNASANAVSTK